MIYGRSFYESPVVPVPYDHSHLWRVSAAGDREPERLDLAGVAGSPTLSLRAHRLAFSRQETNIDMKKLREGGDVETLAHSTFDDYDASFSLDGSKVAFASDSTGEGSQIWVANADGTSRRPVTKGTHKPEGSPRWSPDGQWLAYDGVGDDGQRHIYVIDQAGGPVRPLPSKPGFYDQIPSWSRDGKWIYFGSNRSGTAQVWRVPADGGAAQQVTTAGGVVPFESSDERKLYYSRSTPAGRTLFEMPLTGGPEHRLDVLVAAWNYVPGDSGPLLHLSANRQKAAVHVRSAVARQHWQKPAASQRAPRQDRGRPERPPGWHDRAPQRGCDDRSGSLQNRELSLISHPSTPRHSRRPIAFSPGPNVRSIPVR